MSYLVLLNCLRKFNFYMTTDKITNNLKSFLERGQPLNDIEVVIELMPIQAGTEPENVSRTQKIAFYKQTFMEELKPVADAILNRGGNILGSAWLNQTIKAKVPAGSIEELALLKEVNAIDLPHRLTHD